MPSDRPANDQLDYIERFAKSKGFDIRPRTIFVEGTRDADLFQLAAKLEWQRTDVDLLGDRLAVVAAGERDLGGVAGVCRELITFKNMAQTLLDHNGRPKYRFVGLLDYDRAGREAVQVARRMDISLLEYRDVFYLRPIMSLSQHRDPQTVRQCFETDNADYRALDWELEDLVSESLAAEIVAAQPGLVRREISAGERVHRDWSDEGKARLHLHVRQRAVWADLKAVVKVLTAMWYYLGIKPVSPPAATPTSARPAK